MKTRGILLLGRGMQHGSCVWHAGNRVCIEIRVAHGHFCIRSLTIGWRIDLKATRLELGRPVSPGKISEWPGFGGNRKVRVYSIYDVQGTLPSAVW